MKILPNIILLASLLTGSGCGVEELSGRKRNANTSDQKKRSSQIDNGDATACELGISLDHSGGKIVFEPEFRCEEGLELAISAQPDPGYAFIRWDGAISSMVNNEKITLTKNLKLSAKFFKLDSQNHFYVAANGTAGGTGAKTSPWDLQTALNHPAAVKPGDTIHVRGGVYVGRFVNKLVGTVEQPIIVRAYTGEHPIFDGYYEKPEPILATAMGMIGSYRDERVYLVNPEVIKQGDRVIIDNEELHFFNVQPGGVTYVSRGWNGTTPAPHSAGTKMRLILHGAHDFRVDGGYTWFMGLRFTDSDPQRVTATTGSSPNDIDRGGVGVFGHGIRMINCQFHDMSAGLASQSSHGNDTEYYGGVVYNNGWMAPDRGHGHGFYVQNAKGQKLLQENLVFNNFGVSIQMYGSDVAPLENFAFIGNLFYNGRAIFGGSKAAHNIILRNNFGYKQYYELGYSPVDNIGVEISGNFLDGMFLAYWNDAKVFDNTFFKSAGRTNDNVRLGLRAVNAATHDYKASVMDRNTIYTDNFSDPRLVAFTGPRFPLGATLDEWRQGTGYEANGKVIRGSITSNPAQAFLRQNIYDNDRANLLIYNWPKSDTVAVDLSAFLKVGDKYMIRSVLNYYRDVQRGTYSGPVAVSMILKTLALPVGYNQPLGTSTFPEFGAFVVERVPAQNTAPTATGDAYAIARNQDLNIAAPGVLANDADADGQTLYARLQMGTTNGRIFVRPDGGFKYVPNKDFSGIDSFTYYATDAIEDTFPVTVQITVSP